MEKTPIKSTPTKTSALHTLQLLRRTPLNRAFAAVYICAVLAVFYHHALNILRSTTAISTFLHSSLLIADFILAFMWSTTQSFRIRPLRRQVFVENLENAVQRKDSPAIDVFICTADPFKEPPVGVVNTALSVMAYDYPTEKISVYVSDDGGSKLTLFAFFEAAKFAKHWLSFCRNKSVTERSPGVYFNGNHHCGFSEAEDIKVMYERMKARIENVVERREVGEEYIDGEEERKAFQKWSNDAVDYTSQDHPTVIQVLLESDKDRDISGHLMPNLVYVSRQKSNASPHHFKAGALNVLLRVSATMTNAPIILTQDCDMYSNDPQTPQRALCYFSDPDIRTTLGFVQFPQRFHGINQNDIYACEHKHLYQIKPAGMDGLAGPSYVGSGCFFSRRVFFGSPTSFISPEIEELRPHHIIDRSKSKSIETLTHDVASCNYETGTKWGSKMGFRYGSLSEDYNTGYQMHCQGWRSIFCNPERAAFLGDIPITLFDVLTQNKRWAVGLLQISLNKYSPITFGVRSMGILMGIASSHDPFWPFLSIPMAVYAFLPQLALLNRVSILPKATDLCFLLYAFLFIGAYTQDLIDFILGGGTFKQWWNNQRMWMIRGVTSYLFGFIEYILKVLGLSIQGFNVTSKIVTDQEQSKRYKQGIFEFGVESPMFVTLASAAFVNLFSFSNSLVDYIVWRNLDEGLVLQTILAGFVVLNCWPVYDAVLFRSDKGRMPIRVSLASVFFVSVACKTFSFLFLRARNAI